jgi:hypothetical protein
MLKFSKILEKYKSNLEKSYILLKKDKKHVLFWIYSQEKDKQELLSFENFYENEESARELVQWFKQQESKGIPISRSVDILESESTALENAILGPPPKQKSKI